MVDTDARGFPSLAKEGSSLARRILPILLTGLLGNAVAAQGPQPASLRGAIVSRTTGDPISQATVELRSVAGNTLAPIATTATLENGQFVFPRVAPGQYRLFALHAGYGIAEYGQRRPLGAGQPITLAGGRQTTGAIVAMTPGGVISGRVVDRNGQPAAMADVEVVKAGTLKAVQSAKTNDLGEYRLFWLPPGQYFLRVLGLTAQTYGGRVLVNPNNPANSDAAPPSFSNSSTRRIAAVFRQPGLEENETHVATYYPGTPDPQQAALIDLHAGEEVQSVNVNLAPVRTMRVRGVVIDQSDGRPAAETILIQLSPRDALSPLSSRSLQFNPNNGVFELSEIRPGSYLLRASAGSVAQLRGNAGGRSGRILIDVRDRDLDVSVPINPLTSVSGKVTLEERPGLGNSSDIRNLQISLRSGSASPVAGSAGADGVFNLEGVAASDYEVYVSPLVPPITSTGTPSAAPPNAAASWQDAYVKSIRLRSNDLLKNELAVEGQPLTQLEIVVDAAGASVGGRVVNEKREAIPNATVVLLPNTAPPFRLDRYKVAMTDAAGRFQMRGIAPGEYNVFAWEDVDKDVWLSPTFMRLYGKFAQPIRLDEGQKENIELPGIP